jgi:hypothetical protein
MTTAPSVPVVRAPTLQWSSSATEMPELLAPLDAFLQEHRRCGDLEGGVGADIVWMSCDRPLPVTRLKRPVHWKT